MVIAEDTVCPNLPTLTIIHFSTLVLESISLTNANRLSLYVAAGSLLVASVSPWSQNIYLCLMV